MKGAILMEDKFISIFQLYKQDIYRLAYSYTKDFSSTEDITQSSFIKIYKQKKILDRSNLRIKRWLIV